MSETIDDIAEKVNVILVDDDPMVLKVYTRMFKSCQEYSVTAFSDPLTATEALHKIKNLALIISDYDMPRMNGEQVLTKVKELHPDAKRILVTGNATFYDHSDGSKYATAKSEECFFHCCFPKPFDSKLLEATVVAGIKQYINSSKK